MWLKRPFKQTYKLSSAVEDVALSNIQAVSDVVDLVQTSFGPNYRNKFFINNLGFESFTLTPHAATTNPDNVNRARLLLVTASQSQQAQIGDGTKTVIILAGELLKQAEHLLLMGVHPSEIKKGYEVACWKALKELETLSTTTLHTPLTPPTLILALKSALAPKVDSEDILAALVVEAALAAMPTKEEEFSVDNVRVVRVERGSLNGSKVVRGMVFGTESEGTTKHATAAKLVVFTCALDFTQTRSETERMALIKDADEISGEERLAKIIKEIAASGIKVIIAGSSVSDLALQYLNNHSIAVLKVPSKFELRRICRVTNATPLECMSMPTPEQIGWVDVYETVDFDGVHMTVLRQLVAGDPGFEKSGRRGDGKGENTPTATILLRGSPGNELDFRESAIDDGVSLIRSLLRDRRLVPGAGETELELARRVDVFGSKMKGELQHVVKRFATALQVIPRTLAENAAVLEREGNKLFNPLEGESEVTDRDREAEPPSDGTILADSNSLPYPILDSLATKRKAIENATGAAASVLNIDSDIMRKSSDIKIPQPCTLIAYDFRETTPPTLLATLLDTAVSPIVAIPICILMTYITLRLLPKVP